MSSGLRPTPNLHACIEPHKVVGPQRQADSCESLSVSEWSAMPQWDAALRREIHTMMLAVMLHVLSLQTWPWASDWQPARRRARSRCDSAEALSLSEHTKRNTSRTWDLNAEVQAYDGGWRKDVEADDDDARRSISYDTATRLPASALERGQGQGAGGRARDCSLSS